MCRVSFGISELTGTFCSYRDLIPFRSPDFPTTRYSKAIKPKFRLGFFIVDEPENKRLADHCGRCFHTPLNGFLLHNDIHRKTQILNFLVYLYSSPIRPLMQEMK